MSMQYIEFTLPPLPHYLINDTDIYQPGDVHLSRKGIGVFDLIAVSEGALYMGEDGEQWRLGQGEVLILLPEAAHFCWKPCDAVTRFHWLHFQMVGQWRLTDQLETPSQRGNFYVYSHINKFPVFLPRFSTLREPRPFYALLDELGELRKDNAAQGMWRQQTVFQRVLMALSFVDQTVWQSPREQVAGRTVAFLMQQFDQPIDNYALQSHLSYHPAYINRCMGEFYGCTALEFLKQYWIEQSKLYLQQTEQSVEFISSRIGFNSAAHYGKCFKQVLGCSPQQFRRNLKLAAEAAPANNQMIKG